MARSAPTIEQIRAREEARRESRKRRPVQKVAVKEVDKGPYVLCLTFDGTDTASRRRAYSELQSCGVAEYIRKFNYHDARQKACMHRSVMFATIWSTAQDILRSLAGTSWRQGSVIENGQK